jgi:hypothetical protein
MPSSFFVLPQPPSLFPFSFCFVCSLFFKICGDYSYVLNRSVLHVCVLLIGLLVSEPVSTPRNHLNPPPPPSFPFYLYNCIVAPFSYFHPAHSQRFVFLLRHDEGRLWNSNSDRLVVRHLCLPAECSCTKSVPAQYQVFQLEHYKRYWHDPTQRRAKQLYVPL